MMIAVGVDPGHTGAAARVVVDVETRACRVVTWGAWRRTRRRTHPYEAIASRHAVSDEWSRLPAAMTAAAPWMDVCAVAAVEGIRPHGRVAHLVPLAEAAGMAAALTGATHRPHANEWRRDVLRLAASTPAAGAERAACMAWGLAPGVRALGLTWRAEWDAPAPPSWAVGHVAEAACIAVWAALWGQP